MAQRLALRRRRLALRGAMLACGVIVLSGCQSPPDAAQDSGPGCAPEGAASLSVTAEGELFALPTVAFEPPLSPATTERTVLVEGEGETVELGSIVTVEFVALDGTTGEIVETTGYGAPGIGRTVLTLDSESAMPGLRRALLCSTEGSRVAAVVHSADAMGDMADGLGIAPEHPLVYVFDVLDVAPEHADGAPQPQDPGLPVVEDSAENPTIAVPPAAPPTDLVSTAVLLGSGPAVRAGSDVTIRYRAVLWRNGLTMYENWSTADPQRAALDELLPGVAQALVGQTVGSRVLVVVPPSLGHGPEGDPLSSVTGNDTLVYAIDVLATT